MDLTETYLRQATFFKSMDSKALEMLASICHRKSLSKRQVLFQEGQPGHYCFVMGKGSIQLHKESEDGREIVIKIVQPYEVFAEVILFERATFPVTAIALTQSEVVYVPKGELLRLLDQPAFREALFSLLMRRQRYLSNRIHELAAFDVEQRFMEFLRSHFGEQPKIRCSLSKKDVANAISSTPESLSRLLGRLQSRGLLTWKGQTITCSPQFWAAKDAEL
jgi:CRP/FNR family transcriptional regulator